MADTSTAALVLRLALSLGLVLALVGGFTWVLRRKGLLRPGAGGGRGGRLEVLDRRALNKHASIVLARVGGTAVLLGVTEERVQVLSAADGLDAAWQELPEADTTSAPIDPITTGQATGAPATAGHAGGPPVATTPPVPAHPPVGPVALAPTTLAGATAGTPVMGARRTGLPVATTPATPPARMSIVEALRELTVRRS
ncbi:FliO/MopB family protein [Dermatobacter hominis]|uniref:FliO/MopB family protein n=1 Tax=Dermatobacter hominis TaxID=2884263 RepID=UPI002104A81E|nr:flagellar biosynthetic protein FliO [Dermatobacter hominis]